MFSCTHRTSHAIAGALLASAIVAASGAIVPASAAVIGLELAAPPPPAPHVEAVPPAPGPLGIYAWIPGRWHWDGHRYGWAYGVWQRRAYGGAVWAPGFWDHHHDHWRWRDGRWLAP
jgi:hypothetical protein